MTQQGSLIKLTRPSPNPLDFHRRTEARALVACIVLMLSVMPLWVCADEVEMQNGDRYSGKVVSLNNDILVMQSEVLGKVDLPRGKVALITLGPRKVTNSARLSPLTNGPARARAVPATNAPAVLPAALRELGTHTNLVRQIQAQFLGDAGPEANTKFNELLSGVMSGKLTMDDLRAQAQSAAEQLRALKRDSGEAPGFASDTYLAILDQFLKQSTPPAGSVTNEPAPEKE